MTELRDRRRALVMLVASSVLFGAMAFCAKVATGRLSGAEVALLRFVVGSVPVLVIPSFRRAAFNYDRTDLLIYRGLFGALSVLLYFIAIAHISVGVATLLNYTTPLFSGLIAAALIGEPLRSRAVIPLILAFGGVVLVIHSTSAPGERLLGFGRWELVGLASAILSAAAVTAIRVARRTESSAAIYASFTLFGILSTAPFAIKGWHNPVASEWLALIAMGIFAMGAQLLMTSAFRWIETLVAGVVSELTVVVAMTFGAIWLGDRLTTGGLIGSVLTLGGVIAVIVVSASGRATVATISGPPSL